MAPAGAMVRRSVYQTATLDDLMQDVATLEQKHAAMGSAGKLVRRLRPLLIFVERRAPAIDAAVRDHRPCCSHVGLLRAISVVRCYVNLREIDLSHLFNIGGGHSVSIF